MHFITDLLQTIVFGLVAGITEWLPVSEGAHMLLLDTLWPFSYESVYALFHSLIRIGSAAAVLYLFHDKLFSFLNEKRSAKRRDSLRLWLYIGLAALPLGFLSVILAPSVKEWLNAPFVYSVALIAFGIILILVSNAHLPVSILHMEQINASVAIRIGLFLCLAIVPGTSMYAAALIAALLAGCTKSVAARFSAMAGMPVLIVNAIGTLNMYIYNGSAISLFQVLILIVGCCMAFLASVFTLKWFARFMENYSAKSFGWYRIVFGILLFAAFIL